MRALVRLWKSEVVRGGLGLASGLAVLAGLGWLVWLGYDHYLGRLTPDRGKARREVQRLYDRAGVAAHVERCRFAGPEDSIDSNYNVFRCEVRTPRCTRSFLFEVPRAGIDGRDPVNDRDAMPRYKAGAVTRPCRTSDD